VTFFKTQAYPPQYCPELRDADLDVPVGAQIFLQFRQCSIRLSLDSQSQILDRFCGDSALAATWARWRLFLLSRPAQKSRDALGPGNAYMKAFGQFPETSFPILMRFQNFSTQII
jgi:hypothetical protein